MPPFSIDSHLVYWGLERPFWMHQKFTHPRNPPEDETQSYTMGWQEDIEISPILKALEIFIQELSSKSWLDSLWMFPFILIYLWIKFDRRHFDVAWNQIPVHTWSGDVCSWNRQMKIHSNYMYSRSSNVHANHSFCWNILVAWIIVAIFL